VHILRLNCDDKPGIVAAVATTLSNNQCNIEESAQFNDHLSGQFYMRVVFTPLKEGCISAFTARFQEISDTYAMTWDICNASQPLKTLIMVSQHDHCLNDLLYRHRSNQLPIEITGVVSNHKKTRNLVESHDLPFHYLPVTKNTKTTQEAQVRGIIKDTDSELIVMARYMQILSEAFCADYAGHVINIHHSFLPGFKGARPYHQAYERGVKIIGATAHFATANLDEGPIIAQDIAPVDHSDTPHKMQAMGRDIESRVLARAIKQYSERRIFLNGKRTIIL
jgi:formyltetrahydrofolate deformylase